MILFDSGAASSSSDLKKNMSQRITLLEVDNWDSFTFLSLSIRKDNVHQQGSEDKLYALAKKFAKAGELSKALKVLLRSNPEEMKELKKNYVPNFLLPPGMILLTWTHCFAISYPMMLNASKFQWRRLSL